MQTHFYVRQHICYSAHMLSLVRHTGGAVKNGSS